MFFPNVQKNTISSYNITWPVSRTNDPDTVLHHVYWGIFKFPNIQVHQSKLMEEMGLYATSSIIFNLEKHQSLVFKTTTCAVLSKKRWLTIQPGSSVIYHALLCVGILNGWIIIRHKIGLQEKWPYFKMYVCIHKYQCNFTKSHIFRTNQNTFIVY